MLPQRNHSAVDAWNGIIPFFCIYTASFPFSKASEYVFPDPVYTFEGIYNPLAVHLAFAKM